MNKASTIFHPVVYADDTTLSASLGTFATSGQDRDRNINMELEKVSIWFKVNKLSLNFGKTKAMLFHTKQKRVFKPILIIEDKNIEFVDEFDYLGIILDKHMTWKPHIKKISLKLSKTIGIMSRMKNLLSVITLRTIYNSLFLPHIIYGILCWGSKNKDLLKLQKKAVRTIAKEKYNAHTEPIFKRLNLLKISDILRLQELKFCYKLRNHLLPFYFMDGLFKYNFEIHHRVTRSSNLLHVPKVRCELTKSSVRFFIPLSYNNCPSDVLCKMHTVSLPAFTRYFKIQCIENYEQQCNIRNCFVCSP